MLRNFPHQVNQIPKLRAALAIAGDLIATGEDISDDGVYGYALARARVYGFRGLHEPSLAQLEQRIQQEQQKPLDTQGARAFARDLRRTSSLLGFLRQSDEIIWEITETGQRVLTLADIPNQEALALWRDALLRLTLVKEDDYAEMHPARNMLRILHTVPGIEKHWLAFGLEMADDSRQELKRVLQLITRLSLDEARRRISASAYGVANAVKILPSLLEQTGLIRIERSRCTLTALGREVLSDHVVEVLEAAPSAAQRRRTRRSVYQVNTGADIRDIRRQRQGTRTGEEQVHSALQLNERTNEHQVLVRRLIDSLQHVDNIRSSADAYDILCQSNLDRALLLVEAKTVRGDALVQARAAVGQLLFYEYLDVIPETEGTPIIKVAAFDEEPGEYIRGFLEFCGVLCVVVLRSTILVPREIADYFRSG